MMFEKHKTYYEKYQKIIEIKNQIRVKFNEEQTNTLLFPDIYSRKKKISEKKKLIRKINKNLTLNLKNTNNTFFEVDNKGNTLYGKDFKSNIIKSGENIFVRGGEINRNSNGPIVYDEKNSTFNNLPGKKEVIVNDSKFLSTTQKLLIPSNINVLNRRIKKKNVFYTMNRNNRLIIIGSHNKLSNSISVIRRKNNTKTYLKDEENTDVLKSISIYNNNSFNEVESSYFCNDKYNSFYYDNYDQMKSLEYKTDDLNEIEEENIKNENIIEEKIDEGLHAIKEKEKEKIKKVNTNNFLKVNNTSKMDIIKELNSNKLSKALEKYDKYDFINFEENNNLRESKNRMFKGHHILIKDDEGNSLNGNISQNQSGSTFNKTKIQNTKSAIFNSLKNLELLSKVEKDNRKKGRIEVKNFLNTNKHIIYSKENWLDYVDRGIFNSGNFNIPLIS